MPTRRGRSESHSGRKRWYPDDRQAQSTDRKHSTYDKDNNYDDSRYYDNGRYLEDERYYDDPRYYDDGRYYHEGRYHDRGRHYHDEDDPPQYHYDGQHSNVLSHNTGGRTHHHRRHSGDFVHRSLDFLRHPKDHLREWEREWDRGRDHGQDHTRGRSPGRSPSVTSIDASDHRRSNDRHHGRGRARAHSAPHGPSSSARHDGGGDPPQDWAKLRKALIAGVTAGAAEAVRVREGPGRWKGAKGRRVATAALAAAVLDASAHRGTPEDPGKGTFRSAIGGLLLNRIIHGAKGK